MSLMLNKPLGRFSPDSLFRPESVAVIGAGTPAGAQVMANLLAGGFRGAILPVVADQAAVGGVLAYASVVDLPLAPDLAVIAAEGDLVAAAIDALAARGTNCAVLTGMAHGTDLRALALRTGVRVLGPGSFGIAVPSIGLNASRAHLQPVAGRLALVSQSAALCRAVLDWAEPNGIGFSAIVGVGGNADLGFATLLGWLARDPGTGAILLDIRTVRDRRRFLSAARAAARLRPVVAMRAGGRLLDPSGDADMALEAALRRAGILSVARMDDFLAAAETLTRARRRPPMAAGDRLAIVTNAIGPARMAADAALSDGVPLASLSAKTRELLAASLPVDSLGRAMAGLDGDAIVYVGLSSPIRLAEVAAMLAGSGEVGGVLVVHAPEGPMDGAGIDALAACASTIRVPLLAAVLGETTASAHRRRLADSGVPAFATPEQAVRGFGHIVADRRNREAARELPPRDVLDIAPDRDAVAGIFAAARADGRLALGQDGALSVLAAYGIAVLPTERATSADQAADAAERNGFPAVVKRLRFSPESDGRGVGLALGLHSSDDVRLAARALLERRRATDADAPPPVLLVQPETGRARALLVRVTEDAMVGPVIAFGQGGSVSDALHDVAMDLPPLNLTLAHALIARTRVGRTLGPLRDMAAADEPAVAACLVRVSQLVVDWPQVAGLTINPLFADANGARAADAWISLRPDAAAESLLAITPYPAELETKWQARGETLAVRPIRPEDAGEHGKLFARLDPEDVRRRFFSSVRALTPEMTARLTQVDYDREMAFVAVRANGETCGVSRLVIEPGGLSGEFAVIVEPAMKGRGLARHLMHRLLDWARAHGVARVAGQVLADNAPMLSFVRGLGFSVNRLPGEDDVVEARIDLG